MRTEWRFVLLLVISSFSPTWCHAYSMEEWQANGFSRHEAELFERSHFTFDEARQWLKHVIDAGHAVDWWDNGFTIEEAEQWQSVGVLDGHQALALINRGYTLDIIKQWRQVGARSISDIRRLVEAGFTLRSAGSWHALGYRPLDWLAFIKHGYNFDDARKWRALGFDNFNDIRQLTRQGFELDTAEKWASSGIPYKEWATWKQHGFRVNEVVVWRRAGFRSADMVAQLKKSGITPAVAQQWAALGPSFRDWKKLYDLGLSLGDVRSWMDAGIKSADLIEDYLSLSLTPHSLSEWKREGVNTFPKIKQYIEQGFSSPADLKAWRVLGIHDAPRWVAAGISLDEATQWANAGITDLYTVLNNKRQGRAPDNAVRPWRIPSVYWAVAGIGGIMIIFLLAAYWEEFLSGLALAWRKVRHSH